MSGYVKTKHPVTGEIINVVATGKKKDDTAEFICISPGSNIEKLWLRRKEIFE